MGLVMCSILIDIVWYLVGAKAYWVGTCNYPTEINSFFRLALVMYAVVCVGKFVLFILLAS